MERWTYFATLTKPSAGKQQHAVCKVMRTMFTATFVIKPPFATAAAAYKFKGLDRTHNLERNTAESVLFTVNDVISGAPAFHRVLQRFPKVTYVTNNDDGAPNIRCENYLVSRKSTDDRRLRLSCDAHKMQRSIAQATAPVKGIPSGCIHVGLSFSTPHSLFWLRECVMCCFKARLRVIPTKVDSYAKSRARQHADAIVAL